MKNLVVENFLICSFLITDLFNNITNVFSSSVEVNTTMLSTSKTTLVDNLFNFVKFDLILLLPSQMVNVLYDFQNTSITSVATQISTFFTQLFSLI